MTQRSADLGDVLLGVSSLPDDDARAANSRLRLPELRAWCVVVVDGLGWYNLSERAEQAPFLSAALRNQDTAGGPPTHLLGALPSTTATNLTYLGTSHAGGQTQMLGYTVRNPDTGGLANLISWNGAPDPRTWQRQPTVFERITAAGGRCASVGPWRFEESGLTTAALRGAEYHPAESLGSRTDTALNLLRDGDVGVVYLYWGEIDAIGHADGWRCAPWADALSDLDRELSRLARLLPAGTGLLVTADHGMVDIPGSALRGDAGRIDAAGHPELARDVFLIGGEARFLHLYTDQPEAVAARWQDVLGEAAAVTSRESAIGSGMFGAVTDGARAVIGDVVVAARGRAAIVDSASQSAHTLTMVGMHGSTSRPERTVPLVMVAD